LEALWRCYHVRRDDVTDLPRADARAEHVLTATWLQAANQLSGEVYSFMCMARVSVEMIFRLKQRAKEQIV
jgi:hypothetical protein